jgi:hypothetical protein
MAISSNPQSDESQQQMREREYVLISLVAVASLAFSDTVTAGSCGFFGYSGYGYATPRVHGYGYARPRFYGVPVYWWRGRGVGVRRVGWRARR